MNTIYEQPTLVIVGAGAGGRTVLGIVQRWTTNSAVEFADDNKLGKIVNGCHVTKTLDDLIPDQNSVYVVAFGTSCMKEREQVFTLTTMAKTK